MLLLQVYCTTKPSGGCPTPSLPILHKGGMPTRIQQHGSSPLTTSTAQCTAGKEVPPQPSILPGSLATSIFQQSHQTWAQTWVGVEQAGQTASSNLEAAMFFLPQLGLRRVRIPDPPGTCKDGLGWQKREPKKLAHSQRAKLPLLK